MAKASITSPKCTVCQSGSRLTIDHLLATGAEARATGRRFGLSKDAISRHWAAHVSDAWKAAAKMGPYGSRESLEKMCLDEGMTVVEGLRALYASHHGMLLAHHETRAVGAYITVAREMRATLNDLARITGELLPATTTNLSVVNNFTSNTNYLIDLGEDLAAEFADMPEALDRLHKVLQRRMTAALPAPDVIEGVVVHAA